MGHGRKAYRRRRRRSAGGGQLARPLGARRRRRPRGETGVPSPWPKGVNKHPQPAVSRPVIPTLVRNLVRRHRYGTVLLWRKCSEAPAREGHLVREKDNLNGPETLSAPRRDDWGGTPSKTGEHNRPRERATISVLDVEASEERHFPAPTIACIYTGPLADLLETLAAQASQARRSRGSAASSELAEGVPGPGLAHAAGPSRGAAAGSAALQPDR